MSTPIWYRSETQELVLTYVEDGALLNLSTATSIEFQVKAAPDTADPPLISLAIGSGITLRPQTGDTLGQADIVVTSAQVDALAPGTYYYEVAVVWPAPNARRKYPVPPTKFILRGVVNRP